MRHCAFCPNEADSREHVWDDWLNRKEGKRVRLRRYVTERAGQKLVRKYTIASIKITRAVVCGPCNHGWMSSLTARMKDAAELSIRRGAAWKLTASDVATVTAYAFMKAVIVNHGADNQPRVDRKSVV